MEENARYMVAIAEAGSISEAARRVHLSQPALSQRLKQLETKMGCELFDRRAAPLKPTYAGAVYLAWAYKAIDEEEAMAREVASIASGGRRRLQVGTSLPRGSTILPGLVKRFQQEAGNCTLFFVEAGMPSVHERLFAASAIDCTVLTPVAPEPPLVVGEVICREHMVLVAPRDLDLAATTTDDEGAAMGLPVVDPAQVASLPFIMPPHNLRHYQVIRTIMDASGLRFNVALHSCSSEMTLDLIAHGLGVSLMPDTFTFGPLHDKLALYRLRGLDRTGRLYYNRRADTCPSPDEVAFVNLLREWVEHHPALQPDTKPGKAQG